MLIYALYFFLVFTPVNQPISIRRMSEILSPRCSIPFQISINFIAAFSGTSVAIIYSPSKTFTLSRVILSFGVDIIKI